MYNPNISIQSIYQGDYMKKTLQVLVLSILILGNQKTFSMQDSKKLSSTVFWTGMFLLTSLVTPMTAEQYPTCPNHHNLLPAPENKPMLPPTEKNLPIVPYTPSNKCPNFMYAQKRLPAREYDRGMCENPHYPIPRPAPQKKGR